jgi:uncharacterized oxidoreductase
MKLSGNTVLITGGTSGIGFAFAEAFMKEGSKVIICGRRGHRLEEIKQQYPAIETYQCDVSIADQRKELVQWALRSFPDLNVLVNNAGIQLATDLTKEVDLEKVEQEVDTNFVAPIHLSSLFAPHLSKVKDPVVINISSGLAFAPIAFMPVYCATKAAMHSLCLSMRHQYEKIGIKVFEIAPPSTDTELGHEMRADKTQSHGGLLVSDFITEAMEALREDKLEAPIAHAKGLREKGEAMFPIMNQGR